MYPQRDTLAAGLKHQLVATSADGALQRGRVRIVPKVTWQTKPTSSCYKSYSSSQLMAIIQQLYLIYCSNYSSQSIIYVRIKLLICRLLYLSPRAMSNAAPPTKGTISFPLGISCVGAT